MKAPIDIEESLIVGPEQAAELREAAIGFKSIDLNDRQLCDLELILNRAFHPLTGYLGRADYESVLERMRLEDGALWPVPVCLDVGENLAGGLSPGDRLALRDGEGFMLAALTVGEVWQPDKQQEALAVFGTDDPEKHPGVRYLYEEVGPWYLSGRVEGIQLPNHFDFQDLRLTPAETRRLFAKSGWRRIIAFQFD